MTYDELLALIKRKDDGCRGVGALLAVVELHKPISNWVYEEFVENHHCSCDEWNEYDMGWPCDTIQAIEKELQ